MSKIVPPETLSTVAYQRAFSDCITSSSSLNGEDLSTRHRMESSWKANFPPVMPVRVVVNADDNPPPVTWSFDDEGLPHFANVPDTGYIVPFKESVTQFLSIKCVFDAVEKSFESNKQPLAPSTNRVYSDVWDSQYVRTNPVFISTNGSVLAFQLYYDDVECANPLGSNKGVYKMCVFYATLLNLPPVYRSNLRSIMLVGIIPSESFKRHGPKEFLKPFMDDMLAFQNGIELKIRGNTAIWHAILLNFAGDMPASNYMGGFKETGSASRPCRVCFIAHTDLDSIFHELNCVLRDNISYNNQVRELENGNLSNTNLKNLTRKYGINGSCIFSRLSYFDATRCFPHDVMHAIHEGVANRGTGLMLRVLIRDYDLDLDAVNFTISQIESHREFTRPPPIRLDEVMTVGKKLSFSASEMSSLSNILPLVLGQYFSAETNEHYAHYLILLEIISELQCYSSSESELQSTQYKVQMHNKSHTILYPSDAEDGIATTPKIHSLLHTCLFIRLFGSLRYCWCYRYESKNAFFKKIMRRVCNFKNVPFTLAANHQKLVGLDSVIDGETDYFGIHSLTVKIISVLPSILVRDSQWINI